MKYTEINSTNSQTGQNITERLFEDGTRFYKYVPFNPQIYVKIKEQFSKSNVSVDISKTGWIKIQRTGDNPKLKAAAEQATGKSEVTREEIIAAEVEFMRKSGFVVRVEEKDG
jgi:hypothetical protein